VPLTIVPAGQVATIVTSLEMLSTPRPSPMPPSPLNLVPWHTPSIAAYRTLFKRVGAPWLWFSRLAMDDAALREILSDEAVAIYAVADRAGIEVGLLELDYREAGTCELSFFGLVPELTGRGHGRWLMRHALTLGWRHGVQRLWVHTCTLDHAGALRFYRSHGFVPFAQAIETFADPRLAGILPADAAPQIPLLATSRR
jgi:GNAT superfamily N-acetyltransferase